MSGFQIPGLGQAKPNETLPPLLPLPPSIVAAAATTETDDQMQDADRPAADPVAGDKQEEEKPSDEHNVLQEQAAAEVSIAMDQTESPPSLTHALEAAIGGLEDTSTTQAQTQPQQASQQQAHDSDLQNDQGEHPEWEVDSSPYESSSESSSSDSSDDDSDDGFKLLGIEETARLLMDMEGGSDDEGRREGKPATSTQVKSRNELPEEVIPRPDVTITPEMKIEELGSVEHIVEGNILIKAITPGEYQVLDTGSVLCNADRTVIGVVAETIGKVLQPMYTVRFNSVDEAKELGIQVGTKIFYPVDHALYVFTEPLKSLKGSDASNIHDEEVGDDEMEFSDDEKEAEYKRSLKQQKNKNRSKGPGDGGRGARAPHPLRQEVMPEGSLNYDDGPYKPLARPPGYGTGGASKEATEPLPRSNLQRGGRRGDHGGRGGRGRGAGRGGRGSTLDKSRDGYSLPPRGQQLHHPPPSSSWNAAAVTPPQGAAAPIISNFGFQLPGWPQQPPQVHSAPAPPMPPGWPAQGQAHGQLPGNGALNPTFLAALMNQMQTQNGQQQWTDQQQPPPPPRQGW